MGKWVNCVLIFFDICNIMLEIKPLDLVKESEKGKKFVSDDFELFTRKSGSVSWPNVVDYEKTEYLLQGDVLVRTTKWDQNISGPCAIIFDADVEHSIVAQTDCLLMKLK